jgi:hypothetical protein
MMPIGIGYSTGSVDKETWDPEATPNRQRVTEISCRLQLFEGLQPPRVPSLHGKWATPFVIDFRSSM